MKPLPFLLPALVAAPVVIPLVSAVAEDSTGSALSETLLASLPSGTDRLWIQVRQPVNIEELSSQLSLDETRLARLNDVDEDHQFVGGDWLAVPPQRSQALGQLASLDSSELRSSPPLVAPPPVSSNGVVRFGDSLRKIAQRYGLSLAELLRLNPGLETARLVVGSQVRVAQSAPGPSRSRLLLGLNPVGSGGLSWPEMPRYGEEEPRRNTRYAPGGEWIWPARGVFTSGYGWRWGRMHKGIDVANNVGTPIVAARSGTVTFSGWDDGGYGYLVKITHDDGSVTVYGHNSRLLVREGEEVQQGQTISQMGSTGRSTGPHLHFEIRPPGQGAVNPLQFLPPRA
jgi:murein DD-endopeptidase MepM/ murein hydrolase activator NlpD